MPAIQPASPDPVPNFSRRILVDIPEGPEGTRMTLAMMRQLVREARTSTEIQSLVDKIIRGAANKDFYREAELIDQWVRRNIRYQKDPDGIEAIYGPLVTLQRRAGDCDDICILEATLLKAAGHPARFVAVSCQPDYFEHVYIQTLIGNRWIGSDCTENQPFGWEPTQGVIARMFKDV